MKKLFIILFLSTLLLLTVFSISTATLVFAHPGMTDSNGGHSDGSSYHYHHGYPAHQHLGGSCPYDFDDQTGSSSGGSGSSIGSNPSYGGGTTGNTPESESETLSTKIITAIITCIILAIIIFFIFRNKPYRNKAYLSLYLGLFTVFMFTVNYIVGIVIGIICFIVYIIVHNKVFKHSDSNIANQALSAAAKNMRNNEEYRSNLIECLESLNVTYTEDQFEKILSDLVETIKNNYFYLTKLNDFEKEQRMTGIIKELIARHIDGENKQ